MPRQRRPHIAAEKRAPAPVHVRNILDGLTPRFQQLARDMAGKDKSGRVRIERISILGPGRFEITDPVMLPEGSRA